MGKIDEEGLHDILDAFAAALGLSWHRYSQKLSGRIDKDFVASDSEVTEVTKEDFDTQLVFNYGKTEVHKYNHRKVPTVLGKVNALAEHLGVEFEVKPERTTAEKVTVKKGKK
jgi:hypothetical protein